MDIDYTHEGDRPSSRHHNEMIDAINDMVRRMGELPPFAFPEAASWCRVQNDTGFPLSAFDIVGIGDAVSPYITDTDAHLALFKRNILISGQIPAYATHRGKYAVVLDPVASGQTVDAVIVGVVPVQVDISDASHGYAEIKEAVTTELQSDLYGSARILYKPSGTGVKWTWSRLGTEAEAALIGYLDGPLAQGGSATVNIARGEPGSEALSGEQVLAYDWLMKAGADGIDTGKKVMIRKINGYWYFSEIECP